MPRADLSSLMFRLRAFNPELPDQEREVLIENRTWFSTVTALDDPFEGRPPFKWVDDTMTREAMMSLSRRVDPNLNQDAREALVESILIAHEDVVRRECNKAWIQYDEEKLYATSSVCCFSSQHPTQRQWHYYADQARGYALGFDFSRGWKYQAVRGMEQHRLHPAPVVYSQQNERPVVELKFTTNSLESIEGVRRALLTKSNVWADQNEHRLLRLGIPGGHVSFPHESLVACVLGYRTSPEDEARLRAMNDRRKTPLRVYRAVLSTTTYEVELHTVDER